MHGDAGADQFGGDLSLKIGESEDEIRFQREDFRDVGRGEG
jgi:hypothetical protein